MVISIIFCASFYFGDVFTQIRPLNKNNSSFHFHFSLPHKNIKHFTVPDNSTEDLINISLVSEAIHFFHFPNSTRGIVNCTHFESELTCHQTYLAYLKINRCLSAKSHLYVQLPSDFKSAINSLHFAFLVSVSTRRHLHVTSSPFTLPSYLMGSPPKSNYQTIKALSYKNNYCNFDPIFESKYRNVYLTGKWNPIDLLISPTRMKIPNPFQTHSLFILSRWILPNLPLFQIMPSFPKNELQISIALEFKITKSLQYNFENMLNRFIEGYSQFHIYIWQPSKSRITLNKTFDTHISYIDSYEKAIPFFLSSDVFVGTAGSFLSHLTNSMRGRGGVWFDPRNGNEMETSNSQSGLLLLTKRKASDLFCPNGNDALQQFLTFHAI